MYPTGRFLQPTAQALSRTCSDRVYSDPWKKVLDYRRVLEYSAEHPTAGRVRIGNALDLPNERVRGWLKDTIPDPVRGINTASKHEWLHPEPNVDTAAALVELLAHVLAGGSIGRKTFSVAVTPGRQVDIDEIHTAFERIGVETQVHHREATGRATEVVPAANGSVLGRYLVAMGVVQGDKTTIEQLPSAVWEVPVDVRREFARIYVSHRATTCESKATLQIQEQRPQSYLDDLAHLITELTDESVTAGDLAVTVSADAARDLGLA